MSQRQGAGLPKFSVSWWANSFAAPEPGALEKLELAVKESSATLACTVSVLEQIMKKIVPRVVNVAECLDISLFHNENVSSHLILLTSEGTE